MNFCIMTTIPGGAGYYEKFREHYWSRLRRAVGGLGYLASFKIFLLVTERSEDFNESLLMLDIMEMEVNPKVSVEYELTKLVSLSRGALLKRALLMDPSDYYTFIDFEDSVSLNYFRTLVTDDSHKDIIVTSAVEEVGEDIILNRDLIRYDEYKDSKWDYFIRTYGSEIWGRFFSRNVILKVESRLNDTFNGVGYGGDYKLHNLLFQSARTFGYSIGIYKRTRIKPKINWDIAVENIKESLKVLPEEIRDKIETHYMLLLDKCYNL